MITCDSIPDPRIEFGVDVATKITLVFKSDPQIEYEGINLYILEMRSSSDDSVRIIITVTNQTILYPLSRVHNIRERGRVSNCPYALYKHTA